MRLIETGQCGNLDYKLSWQFGLNLKNGKVVELIFIKTGFVLNNCSVEYKITKKI